MENKWTNHRSKESDLNKGDENTSTENTSTENTSIENTKIVNTKVEREDEDLELSVAIILYNSELELPSCLESLNQQEGSPAFQVLLINNHPDLLSKSLQKNILEACNNLNLQFIEFNQDNLGAARALAANQTKTKWLAFTDPDCQVPKTWLKDLQETFLTNRTHISKLAAVGGASRPHSNGHLSNEFLNFVYSTPLAHLGSPQCYLGDKAKSVDHLPTMNILYERNQILQVGSFSREYKKVGEDLELGWRLRKMGHILLWTPKPCVVHNIQFNLMKWLKRMFSFGKAQIKPLISNRILTTRHILMFAGALSVTFLLPLSFLVSWRQTLQILSIIFLGYILFYTTLMLYKKLSLKIIPAILFLLFMTHLSYGLGTLMGLLEALLWIGFKNEKENRPEKVNNSMT